MEELPILGALLLLFGAGVSLPGAREKHMPHYREVGNGLMVLGLVLILFRA